MPAFDISKSDIPLWSGTEGALKINLSADPTKELTPGANPIVDATFEVDGNKDIALTSKGSVGIGLHGGAKARIVPIFQFVRTGTGAKGEVLGEFRATGFLPSFLHDFVVLGLVKPGEEYL